MKPEEVEFHKALYEISLKKARKENPGINILEEKMPRFMTDETWGKIDEDAGYNAICPYKIVDGAPGEAYREFNYYIMTFETLFGIDLLDYPDAKK